MATEPTLRCLRNVLGAVAVVDQARELGVKLGITHAYVQGGLPRPHVRRHSYGSQAVWVPCMLLCHTAQMIYDA